VSARCERESTVVLVSGLLPGSYQVILSPSGIHAAYLPVGTRELDADRIEVAGDTTETPWYSIPPPTAVSGEVRGSWQQISTYFGQPRLRAFSDDSTLVDSALPREDGTVSTLILWPHPVRFRVDCDEVVRWVGGASFAEATRYLLEPGDSLSLPEILESGILCRLEMDSPTYDMGAGVRVYRSGGQEPALATAAVYGDYVAFSNLDPGAYVLQLFRSYDRCDGRWRTEWYDSAFSRETARPIVIREPGEIVRVDWRIEDGGEIRGRITAPIDDPDWSRPVELLAVEDSTAALCDRWGAEGGFEFRFLGLPDGAYVLRIRYPSFGRYRNWWYPGTRDRLQADTLWVLDAGTVESGAWEAR
jgi:hypothetical protein